MRQGAYIVGDVLGIFLDNLIGFDAIIWVAAICNVFAFLNTRAKTNRVYYHFNAQDKLINLSEDVKKALQDTTKSEQKKLTVNELLEYREQMNRSYAFYANFTTMFPLLGMLGTVVSLIPMVNLIGSETTGAFFTALTSTFWGIVAALIFKFLDSFISYKIEDNEKHMEYLLNPGKREKQENEE